MKIDYKNRSIFSSPIKLLTGKFSTNGTIENHYFIPPKVSKPSNLQSIQFDTEIEAQKYYLQQAKILIDNGLC